MTRVLQSRDELIEWAEDEGALDDSVIVSVDAAAGVVTVGLCIVEDAPDDPRDAFRRTTERFLPFTLSSEGGSVAVEGELGPNAPFESSLLEEGDAFGLTFETAEATVMRRRGRGASMSASRSRSLSCPSSIRRR